MNVLMSQILINSHSNFLVFCVKASNKKIDGERTAGFMNGNCHRVESNIALQKNIAKNLSN